MKKFFAICLILICFSWISCDTQKPANEVEDAQKRVKDKIEGEREKQNAENPENQESGN